MNEQLMYTLFVVLVMASNVFFLFLGFTKLRDLFDSFIKDKKKSDDG